MRLRGRPQPPDHLVGLAARHGGFSTKEDSGALNRPGAYASWEGTEQVISGQMKSTDVMKYRKEHGTELNRAGAYFGGYREPEGLRDKNLQRPDDTTYLDVSRRFVGPNRVERALEFGRKQGQVSIYDTDAGLKYAHENAGVAEDDKYSYSADMADATRAQKSGRVTEMVDAIERSQTHVAGGINEARDAALEARRRKGLV